MPISPLMVGQIAATGINASAQLFGAKKQHKRNMELAQFQADANERYQKEMMEYNSPKSQMERFQEAGLNPHLIYGQGNPGNLSSSLTYPDIKPTDWQRTSQVLASVLPQFNQTRLIDSQVQATNAKTLQSYAMVELNRLQQRVLEKNPVLDTEGFKAIIDGLKSTAALKSSEASIQQQTAQWMSQTVEDSRGGQFKKGTNAQFKLDAELNLLEQKFNLGNIDQSIKGQILQGKEFQNAIIEVQKKFLADGDIGPQQILQFIQLLLMKVL